MPRVRQRVGLISCGYDAHHLGIEGVKTHRELRNDPSYYFIYSWDRRAVDVAVFNAQGSDSIPWWPMHEDSRPGDIMMFSLAPHLAIPFEATVTDGLEWFEASEATHEGSDAVWTPEGSIRSVGETYCSNSTDVLKPEASPSSLPQFGSWPEPLEPGQGLDDSGRYEVCFPSSYQGLGVVTDTPVETDLSFSTEETIFQARLGHIVLFPRALKTEQLEGFASEGCGWDSEKPMEERDTPAKRWLDNGEGFLQNLWEESANWFGADSAQIKFDLDKIRATARDYREGRSPNLANLPTARNLTVWDGVP